ncbi:unnamed protein product [Phaeothamnion confervicola]
MSPGSAARAARMGAVGAGPGAGAGAAAAAGALPLPSYREQKFAELLQADVVKLEQLRQLSWNGVPRRYRPMVWQLLVGYLPANRDRREEALRRKRREYRESVPQYFDIPDGNRTSQEQDILRQILVDVPRTNPEVPFFHQDVVQRGMERVLYIWAIRHPASGYVQGLNDLLTPLYLVFLSAYVGDGAESVDASRVDPAALEEVEADTYWCLTKLLDNIQDHYTNMQPGLQRMVLRLEDLVNRIDGELHRHLDAEGLQFIQFAFRWMNCLLMRELPLRAIIRAWDTYLAEENGFGSFHIYVCAALLCRFSLRLQGLDFQGLVMFLQDLPTREWAEAEVEPLLSQAYILSTLFEHSPNHLVQS